MVLKKIEELFDYENVYIFRGVSNEEYEMVPAIFRDFDDYGNYYSFLKCAFEKFHNLLGLNEIETIEYARHYGAKTNLLDFSYSPLVALFFACYGNDDKDGKLFILNVTKYNKFLFDKNKNSSKVSKDSSMLMSLLEEFYENGFCSDGKGNEVDYPIVLEPTKKFDRVRAQKGLFLFWGTEVDILENLIVKGEIYDECIIPKEKKKEYLSILNEKYSINKDTLYLSTDYIKKLFDSIYEVNGFSCFKCEGDE